MTKIDEHRAKLEALAPTHPWIREVVEELDRMKRITPLSCVNCEMGYWHQINILEDKVDKLTAERDALQREVDNMLVELDSCEAVDEVNSELAAERDRLESQLRQLEWDLNGARTSRDHWRDVSEKHNRALCKLRKQLKEVNEYGTIWPAFADGAKVRIGDSMMYDEREERVQGIRFYRDAVVFEFDDGCHCRITHGFAIGQPVDRPPLNAKDGKPIEIGQTLYGGDGQAWEVRNVKHGEKYPVCAVGADAENYYELRKLKPEWLTHEKPDSFEEIINAAEQLTMLTGIGPDEFGSLVERCKNVAEKLGKGVER